MKKTALFIVALLFWAVPVYAQDKANDPDPFHDWFTYYYLDKNTSKVPDFLKWLEVSGTLEKHPGAIPPMEGFLSIVFADNPAKVEEWSHAYAYTGKAKEVIDYAVKPPAPLDQKEAKTTSDLDMMWGAYFASGNTLYLQKIVNAMDNSKPLTGIIAEDAATRAAAEWSLGSNMTQHESVDRFLQSESTKRTDLVGDALKQIVSNVEKQRDARQFPNHDGEFSAVLLVTDPAVTREELGHASDVLRFKESKRARVGDKRAVLIFFAGMQLSPDYLADVTYDVRLIDPAGKIYSDQKDLEGIKQKVPTRFHIFNTKAVVFITFNAKDMKGVYKINVLLKDNMGKKTLALASKITFRK